MTPDACALLFNDNHNDEEYGYVYGDDEGVSIHNDTNDEIQFNIPGLSDWVYSYVWQVLAPYESGEMSIEEINSTFDWRSFHKEGIRFAIEIKKLLPENIFLKYSIPYEDRSGLIKNDIVIKAEQKYIDLILNKII